MYKTGDRVQVLSLPSDYQQRYVLGTVMYQFSPEYERGKYVIKLDPSGLMIVWDDSLLKKA